ncbi:hypothetical protein JW935_20875 [candidate division KSB1 bacterium]|nr:hypothetical protein [candidate division KSB1 bacterium]
MGWIGYLPCFQWPSQLNGWMLFVVLAFVCYLNGLVFFAMGRFLRRLCTGKKQREQQFKKYFEHVLQAHGLYKNSFFQNYLKRDQKFKSDWRLYIRLWAELREDPELLPSLSLVRRYWILTATYDGLAAALLLWFLILILWSCNIFQKKPDNLIVPIVLGVIALLAFLSCCHEANRLTAYQIEDTVASLAVRSGCLKATPKKK